MRLILAALLLLQAAPAQTEADKVEAAIKKMTDREYRMIVSGREIGTMTLKNRVETEGGRRIAVFESVLKMTRAGEPQEELMIEKANLDGLQFLSRRLVRLGGVVDKVMEVKDGKIALKKIDGATKQVEVTKVTVSEGALYRLPCVQEQKVGAALKIDVLDFDLQKGYELKCVERKEVELGDAKHDAFIWRLSGENTIELPSGHMKMKFEYIYWVTPEGLLLRYSMATGDEKDQNVLELKK